MTAILPYHGKCMWDELRYALRAIQTNGRGITQLCIIGDKPDWCQPDIFIPLKNEGATKEACIAHKIMAAFNHPSVGEDVLFMNDDHYILDPIELTEIPYYRDGTLENQIGLRGFGAYGKELKNTLAFLRDNNYPTFHYDIHVPIRYNNHRFETVYRAVDWSKRPTYVIKSLYTNVNLLGGMEMRDPVIRSVDTSYWQFGMPFMSTTDNVPSPVKEFLYDMFPTKSRWER